MGLVKTGYDEGYFRSLSEVLPLRQIRQKVRLIRTLKARGALLEIGCGEGFLLREMQKHYNAVGVDVSPHAVAVARRHAPEASLYVLDVEKTLPRGRYDVIIAFDVLEHLREPQKVLGRIKKRLKRHGVLVVSVPNNHGTFGTLCTKCFNLLDRTHVSTFRRRVWIELFESLGFDVEIINQTWLGFFRSDLAKHFTFNLVIVARPSRRGRQRDQ